MEPVEVPCAYCETPFYPERSQRISLSRGREVFCSKEHRSAFRQDRQKVLRARAKEERLLEETRREYHQSTLAVIEQSGWLLNEATGKYEFVGRDE